MSFASLPGRATPASLRRVPGTPFAWYFDCMTDIDWANLERRPLPTGEQPKTWPVWAIARADGREIDLESLHQDYIYSGDLLGAMHHPREIVERYAGRAKEYFPWCEAEPVVLPMLLEYALPMMPIRLVPPEEDVGPVTLPRIVSIALLRSHKRVRDPSCCFSSLVVIWFQNAFGDTPEDVKRAIAALDWNALAFDWTP